MMAVTSNPINNAVNGFAVAWVIAFMVSSFSKLNAVTIKSMPNKKVVNVNSTRKIFRIISFQGSAYVRFFKDINTKDRYLRGIKYFVLTLEYFRTDKRDWKIVVKCVFIETKT